MVQTNNSGFAVGFQLTPVAQAVATATTPAASVPSTVSTPALPALQAPRTSMRDVAIYGGMNVLALAGVAGTLSLAGTGAALVAATLATAVSVGATVGRLLGKRPEKGMPAAIESERLAIDSARRMLDVQATGLAVDRERVALETQSLIAMRQELASDRTRDRQALEDTLSVERSKIASQVAKMVEDQVAPLRKQLQHDREALQHERDAFESRKEVLLAPIVAEMDALSRKEINAIREAIEVYTSDQSLEHGQGFVSEAFYEYSNATPLTSPLSDNEILTTLMTRGRVYAGPIDRTDSDDWVIYRDQSTALTSVADLIRFLRAATGKKI